VHRSTKITISPRPGERGWKRQAGHAKKRFDKAACKPGGNKAEVTLEL
jgi:hypothetical protein